MNGFLDGLEDEPLITARSRDDKAPITFKPAPQEIAQAVVDGHLFIEVCTKCRGTGSFRGASRYGRACFACKGEGKFYRKTSPEVRAKAKARVQQKKVQATQDLATQALTWMDANPAEAAWLKAASARGFGLATRYLADLMKYGSLLDGKVEAIRGMAAADATRAERLAAERMQRESTAPEVSMAALETAFANAAAKGGKKLILRAAGLKFSPAKATSANAGAIYVKRGEEYLGKIDGGKFKRAWACDEVTAQEVAQVASNPKAAAIAYGRETGSCACCGRELTDKASIELGIGPVCATKFGW